MNTNCDNFTYVSFSEVECERSVSNWLLPGDCGVTVNTTCDDFTHVSFSEVECERSVSNWLLPGDCGVTVNTTCDNFTCVSGYQPTQNVVTLQCMENGTWNLNPEALCEGRFHSEPCLSLYPV